MENKSLSIVICHFGDPWWVLNLLRIIEISNNSQITNIIIFDNSNNLELNLLVDFKMIHSKIRVVLNDTTLKGNRQHAYSLNKIKYMKLNTSHVCILDSDIVFTSEEWPMKIIDMLKEFDSILGLVEGSKCLAHSCFQVIPVKALQILDFSLGMNELNFDTGRLIGLQLVQSNFKVKMLKLSRVNNFRIGYFYQELNFFHITSASLRNLPGRPSMLRIEILVNLRNQILKSLAIYLERTGSNRNLIILFQTITKNLLQNALSHLKHKIFR